MGVYIPSGITDFDPNNNYYYRKDLDVITTTTGYKDISLPNINQECPTLDLAVKSVSQNFSGEIATTPVMNDDTHSTDLIVDNPRPLSFTVEYENK